MDRENYLRILALKRLFPAIADKKDKEIFKVLNSANNKAEFFVETFTTKNLAHSDNFYEKSTERIFDLIKDFFGAERCTELGLAICFDKAPRLRLVSRTVDGDDLRLLGSDENGYFMFVKKEGV